VCYSREYMDQNTSVWGSQLNTGSLKDQSSVRRTASKLKLGDVGFVSNWNSEAFEVSLEFSIVRKWNSIAAALVA